MLRRIFFVFLIIYTAQSEIAKKDAPEQNRMMGVDTVHDIKIDKDTVISRNLLLDRKIRGKSAHYKRKQDDERDPDWSYSAIPPEVASHAQDFKRNMSECLKEVQASDKRTVKRLSPKQESPVHGECLIACVLKRNGVIDGGKINKANLLSLVSKFYAKDTKLMKKLEKNLDRCIEGSIRSRDECVLAAQLNSCTNELISGNKHKIIVNY